MKTLDGKNMPPTGGLADRVPPHLYFVGSALFHYLGPSFAVLLFARVPAEKGTWLIKPGRQPNPARRRPNLISHFPFIPLLRTPRSDALPPAAPADGHEGATFASEFN
jgi:hypothetical protein